MDSVLPRPLRSDRWWTKRVSVLMGNHQPLGAAQTKRLRVLDGDHRVLGNRRSHGSEE